MANQLITTSKITFECLEVLENNLGFSAAVNRDYDDQFAQNGGKIGATVNVRKPPRYQVGSGPVIDPQGSIDTYVPVTLTDQLNVALAFTSADLALSVDDFRTRIIQPAMAALANKIDYLGCQRMSQQVANIVGTAGQITGGSITSAQAINAILQAGQKLDENAAPMDEMRAAVISPATNTGLVQAQASLFNPTGTLSRQFTKGALGDGVLGFNFARDQNIVNHTYGSATSATVSGAQGASNTVQAATDTAFSLTISALSGTLTAGTSFTIAGIYAVNPQSRQSTGQLQNFVLTADAANGATSLSIFPYPVFTGPFQNVTSSSNSIPNSAAIALVGSPSASTAYPMNLFFHKNAFTLASADLPLPTGSTGEARRASSKAAGLSLRLVRDWYDARTDQFISRIDVLLGWKAIYPELAVKVQG